TCQWLEENNGIALMCSLAELGGLAEFQLRRWFCRPQNAIVQHRSNLHERWKESRANARCCGISRSGERQCERSEHSGTGAAASIAAPPSSVMSSRRVLIRSPRRRSAEPTSAARGQEIWPF